VSKLFYRVFFVGLFLTSSLLLGQDTDLQGRITTSRKNAITHAIENVSPAVAGINVTAIQEYVSRPRSLFWENDPLYRMLFPEETYRRRVKSLGSGVVISKDGYVITNAHVVEGAEKIIVTLTGGEEHEAELVGADQQTDVALLKISGKVFAYAEMGNSDEIITGEWVIALGNPFGLFDVNYKPTATIGIVSGMDLDFGRQENGRIYQDMIQTDASINTGNSGGPLVNANGEVIGVNTFIFTGGGQSEGSVGIGFAIPINRVKTIIAELEQKGEIDRSWKTGIEVQNVDQFLARYLGLPSTDGVIVTEVERSSAAQKAGIKVGDVILQVNNRKVTIFTDIRDEIQENFLKAGDVIKLYIQRGKDKIVLELKLE